MARKRVIQKLITFESKKKDLGDLNKELVDGWYIASIMPHKNTYLCVLEKKLESSGEDGNISVKEALELATSIRKNKVLQDA